MNKIHPTAIIEKGAVIGDNVEIGPYCIVGPQVTLNNDCVLRSHVVIEGRTTIGKENVFFQFASIGSDPQDLKYHHEDSMLTIGESNTFREGVTIHKGTEVGRGKTTIGDQNLVMGYVHVAHDCQIGSDNVLANYTGLAGHIVLDDHITIGGFTGITQFVRIGSYSYIGAGTTIDKHIAPYTTGYGNRIQVKGVNIVGLKRRGFSREAINNIMDVHRLFFRSEMNEKDAMRSIKEQYGHLQEVQMFIDFVSSVEGGVRK
ncbi:MAG: acyl-ACP--UDP-N-acetylglucosamine O-acyltransferase [SAR324 cluster bacterium]|nr:acyl-ACP--UDP-N-acetylglucosamine O-acyltransferase [SAR324 cluster bacterium]